MTKTTPRRARSPASIAAPVSSPDAIDHAENTRLWAYGGEVEPGAWHDYQAENYAAGALMMRDEAALEKGIRRLKPAYFIHPLHRAVFEAIVQLYQRRHACDEWIEIEPIIVCQYMQRIGTYDPAYLDAYLWAMMKRCPSSANIGFYIETLIEAWRKRQEWYLARTIAKATKTPGLTSQQILNALRLAADAIEHGNEEELETIFERCK